VINSGVINKQKEQIMFKHYGTITEIKLRTLKEIKELQKQTNWWGDKKLNNLLNYMLRTPEWDEDAVILIAEEFQKYKPQYLDKVSKF